MTTETRYLASVAAIRMAKDASVMDLSEDEFAFLLSDKPWISTDRNRAKRCIEAAVFGTVDYMGMPRFEVPAEYVAGVIAFFVHPINIMMACSLMEGCEWSENMISGETIRLRSAEIFAHTLQVRAGFYDRVEAKHDALARIYKED